MKIDSPNLSHGPDTVFILGFDVNRGKRNLLLDLRKVEGKDVFDRLLQKAEVVIYNGPDAVMPRVG
ncbi:CoA transferase [Bradyrhizobium sp. USDA 4529]